MKRIFLLLFVIPVFLFSQEMKKNKKVLTHVVLLKFKDKADTGLFEKESYQYLSTIEGVNIFCSQIMYLRRVKVKGLLMLLLCSLILNLIEIQSIYHIRNIFRLLKNTGEIM